VETGRPTIPKASPRALAVTRVDGRPVWSDVRRTRGRRLASSGPPRRVRAATGSLVDAFEPRLRELLRPFLADAGDGDSRSGSASRSDSLIGFVKPNVAILPLLVLTATTASDEPSYGLNDTAVDGLWIGSNWASTGEPPLADTLASIMDSAPHDGAAACTEEGRGINCK
jgi:hypothetical protein